MSGVNKKLLWEARVNALCDWSQNVEKNSKQGDTAFFVCMRRNIAFIVFDKY